MDLKSIRNEIDMLDDRIAHLLSKRMDLVSLVAAAKKGSGAPVRDNAREDAIIARLSEQIGHRHASYIESVFRHIFDASRQYQAQLLSRKSEDLPGLSYGLIGEKLGHSYSPMIHQALADYEYVLHPLSPDQLPAFFRESPFKGINVTIPYKKHALDYCDLLSDDAREIGCVNTVVRMPDGRLMGHNTDIAGFIEMVNNAGIPVAGKKAVILGSGGTSLTARLALARMGAGQITVISRSTRPDYDDLYRDFADAQVLVNTTPVGMYPNNGQCPADLSRLPRLESVVDVIYNPEKTALILSAQQRGLHCVSGLSMLVAQARLAAEIFTGRPIPQSRTNEIVSAIRAKTLNLVLVGMPGSGKTTIGQKLAERMHRPFFDADQEIEKAAGKTIPDIFATDGEEAFRCLESTVLQALCKKNGCVIATGGGAVLRRENQNAIRQNGIVCRVSRPLDHLDTAGRPLSVDAAALARLSKEREPIYCQIADYTVENTSAPEQAVNAALEGFYETLDSERP